MKLDIKSEEYKLFTEIIETIEQNVDKKEAGNSILLTRKNVNGLSCLTYLESYPVENI